MDPYVVCTLTAQAVLCPNQPNATEYLINACLV